MVDVGAIAGLVGALKGATDIAKAMKDLNDASAVNAKVIELQAQILSAQTSALEAQDERATLIDRIRALEAEVADLKAWDAQKKCYELKPTRNGNNAPLAYAPKEIVEGAGPVHWLCPTCYENRKKSVLQPESRVPGRAEVLTCHSCGLDLYVQGHPEPAHFKNRTR
ncbi:MAG: hypothetical protein MJA84_18075 [Firmicutes bacterium]|nr:hypothetical protein [Bacillota bacterium]